MGKKKAKAKKNKNTPTNDDFLEHVSLSCACCKFPGTAWPAIRGDRRRVPLAGTKTNGYHNLFRDKVGRQEKKAKQILKSHAVQCTSADKKGNDRPHVPKSIKFAAEVKGVSSRLEAKIVSVSEFDSG